MLISIALKLIILHNFYVGTVKVEHNHEQSEFSIEIKIFQDDLTDALRNFSTQPMPNDIQLVDKNIMESYFQKHLFFKINKEILFCKLISITPLNDIYLLKFYLPYKKPWNRVEIKANFLMELFPTQINVVQFSAQQQQFFHRLNQTQQSVEFNLKK